MTAPQHKPVIAVIDDDNVYQFTASRTIQATHLANTILQFQNGQDALSFLSSHVDDPQQIPDIIFLDINMPITDGWMFLDEFNKIKSEIGKEIKVYVVSSSIDPRDLNRARSNPNVVDYVEKPISMNRFAELLRKKLLDRFQLVTQSPEAYKLQSRASNKHFRLQLHRNSVHVV